MRFICAALLLGLCAYANASAYTVVTENYEQKQKSIWALFKYVNQPSYYKEHVDIASNYNIEGNAAGYSKPEVVHNFVQYYNYGMLPRGEIFSIFHEEHLKQAVALFELLYHAKDYDTFYKTAVWARQHCNEGIFLYSVSVAIVHRPDTYYIVLPPIYEIYPYYFYNSEVIHQAQHHKQCYYGSHGTNQYNNYNNQVIYANYSGHYLNLHPEQSMSYFTEDVGVNSFYYYYNLYYPYWMNPEEYHLNNDHYGELFYYIYQQILARYYLERLSNGFGEIEYYNWDVPFQTGYYPSLTYPNGHKFPTRANYVYLHEYFYNYGQRWSYKGIYGYSHTLVQDCERHILDAIDSGYVYSNDGHKVDIYTEEGINVLGNLVQSQPDSRYFRYYGAYQVFARHLLGYSYQPLNSHKLYPSALEHFETSLRDPAFYMLYKRLILHFQKYKYHLKSYTKNDLYYNGVNIDKVEFDHLVTYFDYFYADITNAVYVTSEEMQHDTFKVNVAQERLNHEPFTYKVHVHSNEDTDCVVRVYLGPKYDEYGRHINISENYVNFVQFDHFRYHMKSGQNSIVRNSKEIYNYMHDRTNYEELHQKAYDVYNKRHYFEFNGEQILFGFPQRFMLPKGSQEGTTYQFYVIVSPYVPYKAHEGHHYPIVGSGTQYVDGYPMGYPFDRHIQYEKLFYEAPNSYFYEAKIYHKHNHHDDVSH